MNGTEQHISPSEALLVIPVSRQILKDAAQLRAFFKNKLPDTIHLITALTSGCTYFVTNDDRIKFPPQITPVIISKLTP
jgi:predicted nucleic acid-binding protein